LCFGAKRRQQKLINADPKQYWHCWNYFTKKRSLCRLEKSIKLSTCHAVMPSQLLLLKPKMSVGIDRYDTHVLPLRENGHAELRHCRKFERHKLMLNTIDSC